MVGNLKKQQLTESRSQDYSLAHRLSPDLATGPLVEAARCRIVRDLAQCLTMPSTRDPDRLLKEISHRLVERFGYVSALCFLFEPRERIVAKAVFSARDPLIQRKVRRVLGRQLVGQPGSMPSTESLTGRLPEGRILVGSDLAKILSPPFPESICRLLQEQSGSESFIVIPLLTREGLAGGLVLESEAATLNELDGELLRLFADQAIVAIRQAQLLEQEKKQTWQLALINDALPVGVLVLDAESRVVSVNRKISQLVGIPESQLVGKPITEVILPGEPASEWPDDVEANHRESVKTAWVRLLETIERVQSEAGVREVDLSLPFLGAKGKDFRALVSSLVVKKRERQTLIVVEDDSEKSRLTEHLVQSEKQAAIGEIAVTIAHELGNPLGLITSAVDFVRDRLSEQGVSVPEELNLIGENLLRMHELLRTLSELSGPEPVILSPADLHQALNRVLSFIRPEAENRRVAIETRFDPTVPFCWVDLRQLKQVFLNLFKNALEAMPQGGRLVIRTKRLPTDLSDHGGTVLIEVSDTGAGIPEADSMTIFKPFYSTKEQGSGLGLFFCQQIIEKHRGQLTVRSQPEQGTTFSIRLPINRE